MVLLSWGFSAAGSTHTLKWRKEKVVASNWISEVIIMLAELARSYMIMHGFHLGVAVDFPIWNVLRLMHYAL